MECEHVNEHERDMWLFRTVDQQLPHIYPGTTGYAAGCAHYVIRCVQWYNLPDMQQAFPHV